MADVSGGLVLRRIREPFPGVTVVDCDGFALSLDDWNGGVTCVVYDTRESSDLVKSDGRITGNIRGSFTITGRPMPRPPPESVARLSPLLWSIDAVADGASLVLRNGGTILLSRGHVIGLQPGLPPEIVHTRAGLRCHGSTSRREP